SPCIYTLSLHDALPISVAHRDKRAVEEEMDVALIRYQLRRCEGDDPSAGQTEPHRDGRRVASERRPLFGGEELQTGGGGGPAGRSEEHTSELQSRFDLV